MLTDQDRLCYRECFLPDIERMNQLLEADPLPIAITDAVRCQLDHLLVLRLNEIAFQPLQHLQEQIAARENALAAYGLQLITQEEREKSLHRLLENAQSPAFFASKLPRCRRYMDAAFRNYLAYIRGLFNRIAERKAEIESQLLNGSSFTQITKITCDAGDLHNHGQSTALIETNAGNFVYKPHNPGIDCMMQMLTQQWFSDTLRIPGVVAGNAYGFHEFIVSRPAATPEEADAFYSHLGGQCAIFHMLGSYDLHVENFLAVGSMPIPIDLETMLMPQSGSARQDPCIKEPIAFSDIRYSLWGSALYPITMNGQECSVLMCTSDRNKAAPVLDGRRSTVLEYEEAFFRGFSKIYHRCMAHKEELADFLQSYPPVPIRKLLKSTAIYAKLLAKLHSYREKSTRDDLQLLKQILNRPDYSGGLSGFSPVADCEAESLQRGDVPYFYTMSNAADLMYEHRVVYPGFMQESGIDYALSRLQRMTEVELDFEIRLFREALEKQLLKVELAVRSPRKLKSNTCHPKWLPEAEKIFRLLEKDAVRSPGGGMIWMEMSEVQGHIIPIEIGLTMGLSGILVFLAALSTESRDAQIQLLAKKYCNEILDIHEYFAHQYEQNVETLRVGYDCGAAGILLALHYANSFLHSERCSNLIQRFLRLLRKIPQDSKFLPDYLSGMAGLVHVLCKLPGQRDEVLIRRFADEILNQRTFDSKLPFKIWDTAGKHRGLSGIGHGQAGIGVALWNAYQVLGEEKYRQAALDCFHWEHQMYNDSLASWPDLREITARPVKKDGFCSGAPGIGIALLCCNGLSEALDTYDQDLHRALEAVYKMDPLPRDHLCCGNMAGIDFLLEYGRCMDDAEALTQAKDRMAEIISQQETSGEFCFVTPGNRSFFAADLFYGITGIGYTLLRMHDDGIPSVLRLTK